MAKQQCCTAAADDRAVFVYSWYMWFAQCTWRGVRIIHFRFSAWAPHTQKLKYMANHQIYTPKSVYCMPLEQVIVHCEPKKHTKMFLWYLPQHDVDSDKISYTLFWINLRYSSLNVFQITWIMSLHYLVKVCIVFCKWIAIGTANPKHTKCFCHIVYKTRPILIKFYTYCPEYIC